MGTMGITAACTYAYSNARVKAMEGKLINADVINEISKMGSVENILARLLQTDYRAYIEEFGGMGAGVELLDFALSKSLAEDTHKLIKIAPSPQRGIMMSIAGRWGIHDIKLLLYAKSTGRGYESISKHFVNTAGMDPQIAREVLAEQSVEGAISRMLQLTPTYKDVLQAALDEYKRTNNVTEANAAIDKLFYKNLGGTIRELSGLSFESARVVKLDIEMRNILMLLRAKRYGIPISKASEMIIENGTTEKKELVSIYESAKGMKEFVEVIKSFDLRNALASYESGSAGRMLLFEIAMRNYIFKKAMSLLRHSVLSFAVIVDYLYLKEIEVFTLRVLAKGKQYGLSEEEIKGMIGWQM